MNKDPGITPVMLHIFCESQWMYEKFESLFCVPFRGLVDISVIPYCEMSVK